MKQKTELCDGQMRRVWHTAKINITDWTFYEQEDAWRDLLAAGLAVRINGTLKSVFEERPPELNLPCTWWPDSDGVGGKCPDDPATLYLGLPLGETEDDYVYWALSLESVVDDLIDSIVTPTTEMVDGDSRVICNKLATRLREIADKLDNVCVAD
jgi:hypothetical protein